MARPFHKLLAKLGLAADEAASGSFDGAMDAGAGNDFLFGGSGNDYLIGGEGDDRLYGRAGNDLLSGGEGNDTLSGDQGTDTLDGGNGTDTADFSSSSEAIAVNLASGTLGGIADLLISIENFAGSSFDDQLSGDANGNVFIGGAGHDVLVGRAGGDTLDGGQGNDRISGGPGGDLLSGGQGDDTIIGGSGSDAFLYGATSLGSGDVAAGERDSILAKAGDRISMAGLVDELEVGGVALSALSGDAAIGSALGADTNIAFVNGSLLIDVDGDGSFSAAQDFEIALAGVIAVAYDANGDVFQLS